MTVNTTNITSGPFTGNGITIVFSYTFRIEDKTQVKVFETTAAGTETLLVVDTDYTVDVSGIGKDGGGTITRIAGALPTNAKWYIRSNYAETQLTAFASQGGFFPDVHEAQMDVLTFLVQQLRDSVDRMPKLSDSFLGALPLSLADPVAGALVRWNGGSTGFENVNPANLSPSIILEQDVSKQYTTTAAMKADSSIVAGKVVITQEHTAGRGNEGSNRYLARAVTGATDDDGSVIKSTGNLAIEFVGLFPDGVNVKQFGAAGDGDGADSGTDDYFTIVNFVAFINATGGGVAHFPFAIYFVNQFQITGGPSVNTIRDFKFLNTTGLVIEGHGSLIKMRGGYDRPDAFTIPVGIDLTTCKNTTINNLRIDGGAATMTQSGGVGEGGLGLRINGCTGLNLNNVDSSFYSGDSIRLGESGTTITTNVTAIGCNFHNSARQAMTIAQGRFMTFINTEFSNSGSTGTYGSHSPSAGVDIEPNSVPPAVDDFTGDITFIGCTFKDNLGAEYVGSSISTVTYPIQFFGCTFIDDSASTEDRVLPATAMTRFVACDFQNCSLFPGFATTTANITEAINCTFDNTKADRAIISLAATQPILRMQGCSINCLATTAHSVFRINIQNANTEFTNNRIFVSKDEHDGVTSDVHSLVQLVKKSTGNIWDTDLITGGLVFTISYGAAAVEIDDEYTFPTFINETTVASTVPRFLKQQFPGYREGTRFTKQQIGEGASGAFTSIVISFSGNNASGNTIINISMNGATGVFLDYAAAKNAAAAGIAMRDNSDGGTSTVLTGAGGELIVTITTTVTNPVVFAECIVGGLSTKFTNVPTIVFS